MKRSAFLPFSPRRLGILSIGFVLFFSGAASAESPAERAESLIDKGCYAEGLKVAESAAKTASDDDPEPHGIYGRALFSLKRYKEAQVQFEAAFAKGWEEYASSYLARIAWYHGREEEAARHLAKLPADHWLRTSLSRLMKPKGVVRSATTKHYVVWAHPELHKLGGGRFAGKLLELIHKAYAKVFPFKTEEKRVSHVYIFPTQYEYRVFLHGVWGEDKGKGSTGTYFPGQGVLCLRTEANAREGANFGFSAKGIRTLFHEAFHQYIDMFTPDVPDWLNEGMAEYFETAVMAGRTNLKVGIPQHDRLQDLRDSFAGRASRTHPVKSFLEISYERFHDANRESLNYSQAWGLIHFLLHGPGKKQGRKALKVYFNQLREGASAAEAHAASFGGMNLEKLEGAWKRYVNRF